MTKRKRKSCSRCLTEKNLSEYYISSSTLIHADGRLGICKNCLSSIVDFESRSSVIDVMRAIDRPFLHDMYQIAKDHKNQFGEYMRLLGMPQNRNLNYGDSIFKKGESQYDRENPSQDDEININDDDMEYLIEFWGRGFSKEEYEFLQLEYERYADAYDVDSRALEILFQEAAHQRLVIKRLREKGESADRELKTLQDLLESANVKPNKANTASATEQATLGTLIKQFENEHPIPEPDPAWKDVDGIKKYFNVWFLGHLSKMLGLKNESINDYEKEIGKYTVNEPQYKGDE